jgi:hypothetical protein
MPAWPASATKDPDRVNSRDLHQKNTPIKVIMACEAGRTLIG